MAVKWIKEAQKLVCLVVQVEKNKKYLSRSGLLLRPRRWSIKMIRLFDHRQSDWPLKGRINHYNYLLLLSYSMSEHPRNDKSPSFTSFACPLWGRQKVSDDTSSQAERVEGATVPLFCGRKRSFQRIINQARPRYGTF